MRVNFGRGNIGVAQKSLDHPQVGAMGQKMGRKGMSQDMRRDPRRRDAGQYCHVLDQAVEILPCQMPLAPRAGKEMA